MTILDLTFCFVFISLQNSLNPKLILDRTLPNSATGSESLAIQIITELLTPITKHFRHIPFFQINKIINQYFATAYQHIETFYFFKETDFFFFFEIEKPTSVESYNLEHSLVNHSYIF